MTGDTSQSMRSPVMARQTLEERVSELERQLGALIANGAGRAKDWRRTRGAFTGDDLMKEVFAEGRKIRGADRKPERTRSGKKRLADS
jgi:hypothetical protein